MAPVPVQEEARAQAKQGEEQGGGPQGQAGGGVEKAQAYWPEAFRATLTSTVKSKPPRAASRKQRERIATSQKDAPP